MKLDRVFAISFASIYPLYVKKAKAKGRKQKEVDEVICWLTGYSPQAMAKQIERKSDLETFFKEAPRLNPKAKKITGTICGVRIEEIEHPLMRGPLNLPQITLACGFGIESRVAPFRSRARHPRLSAWLDRIAQHPSLIATAPGWQR